ncbi:hypothetical protein A7X12_08575 [Sphingomonas sp. TDK1]|nr:hypothetical protein A7X12_08575 [Sphingomonas sp. TDK1]
MTPAEPDRDTPPMPSLAGQLGVRLQGFVRWRPLPAPAGQGGRWPSVALVLLIAAGPMATMLGAMALASKVEAEARAAHARLAPRVAAERAWGAARDVLSAALHRAGPAQLLDQLAAVLPADASVARAERLANGALEIEIATSDPDALRAALRRSPALAGLRDVRQQEGEGRTLVLLRQVEA